MHYYFYLEMNSWVKIKLVFTENGAVGHGGNSWSGTQQKWVQNASPLRLVPGQTRLPRQSLQPSAKQSQDVTRAWIKMVTRRTLWQCCGIVLHHHSSSSSNKAYVLMPFISISLHCLRQGVSFTSNFRGVTESHVGFKAVTKMCGSCLPGPKLLKIWGHQGWGQHVKCPSCVWHQEDKFWCNWLNIPLASFLKTSIANKLGTALGS